ncbi:MAG: HNH endonuclease [Sedimentisphaerales bacterium]
MAYILDVMSGSIEPKVDRIGLEQYIKENSYITKFLSRVVKDKALAIYHVLFHLSYFETGKGEVIIPWAKVGSFIRSDQGNIIDDSTTVKRRLGDLLQNKCITINRKRGGANEIFVHLPSKIEPCRKLIEAEEISIRKESTKNDVDYYTDPSRRLNVFDRDNRRCVYCLLELSEDSFFLDHLIPVSKGGTNRRYNLAVACEGCNQRKQDKDPIEFLQSNYRSHLIKQNEYIKQKEYIESLLNQQSL